MNFLFLLLCFVFGSSAVGAELLVGGPAPGLQAKLLNSVETFQLSQKHGKVVIVNFWATWCAPCKAEMPTLQAYLDRHKSDGLEILAISMDEPRDLSAVEKIAQLYTFQVALKSDTNFKGLGRIWRMPTTFVVDRDGILRKNGHVGDAEITPAELEALVTPLLAKP
jgi:thiol-disulfide isomerase/thioredoxin